MATEATVENSTSTKKKSRREAKKKKVLKLKTDTAFAKTYFEGKTKRAADRKSAFRKKKTRKK